MRQEQTLPEPQEKALQDLYLRSADGSKRYSEFRERANREHSGLVGIIWCGMFVGIEPDGYTHS